MSKATAEAPSNIAFVKYWGTRDTDRTLPYNPSISMTLADCVSRCTVEWSAGREGHEIAVREPGGELAPAPEAFASGVERHLDRLLAWAGVGGGCRVGTGNSFPTGAGLASSASGFAALTVATLAALGREVAPDELSVLARRSGSGSAARSVLGGYVEWPSGVGADGGGEAPAAQLAPAEHWALADVVAVVDASPKEVSSRQGHARAPSSPYFERRLGVLPERLAAVRAAIAARDMAALGPVVEEEAIELHLIAMSSKPPIFYWKAGTLAVLEALRRLRQEGVQAWATIDAGPNVHAICELANAEAVGERLAALPAVERVISDRVGAGPRILEEHLF